MYFEWLLPLILGWIAGWGVNYSADVLPFTRHFSKPTCIHCNTAFLPIDYLFFRRCQNGHSRSFRNWVVQITMTALSVYTYSHPPAKIGYLAGMLLLIYLSIVFVIDMEHRLILHPTSIAGSLVTLALGTVSHGLVPSLLGGLGGFLIMLLFYYLGVLFTKIRMKRMRSQGLEVDDEEALGQGDVILATVLGFLVGWPLIWFLILVSALLGGVISILLIIGLLIKRQYNDNVFMVFIPYGPYFIAATILIVYFPAFLKTFLPV